MQNVPSAAFDPIFYMHHWYDHQTRCLAVLIHGSNIDRFLAIWQVLYWEARFPSKDPPEFSIPRDPLKNPSPRDPLPPFHHQFASGTVDYFKSNDLREWWRFGYQYDVLVRKTGETDAAYIARIKAYVEKTYENTGRILLDDQKLLFKDIKIENHGYDDYLIDVCYDR